MTSVSEFVENRAPLSSSRVRLEFLEVVDLPVEDDGVATTRTRHWLVSCRQVDDRQPFEAQAHAAVHENPFVVRPAVVHGRRHPPQQFTVRRTVVPVKNARYAAHGLRSPTLTRYPWIEGTGRVAILLLNAAYGATTVTFWRLGPYSGSPQPPLRASSGCPGHRVRRLPDLNLALDREHQVHV